MTVGRDIVQYIDIHDTSNGHIEIDDRMRPIHDYPGGGAGSHNVEFSYNHYPAKVKSIVAHTKKVTCTFCGHWNSREKYKVSPMREFSYPGHRINSYYKALLPQNIGYFESNTCTKVLYESNTLLNFVSRYLEFTFHVKFQIA